MNSFDPATGYSSAGSSGSKASLKVGLAMCVMLVLLIIQGSVGLVSFAGIEAMQEESGTIDAPGAALAEVRVNLARAAYFSSRLTVDHKVARERCMAVLDESMVTLDALGDLSGRGNYHSLASDLKMLKELVHRAAENAEEKDAWRHRLGGIHHQLQNIVANAVATQNDIVKKTVAAQPAKPREVELALSRLSLMISILDAVHNLRAQALAFASLDNPDLAREAGKTISWLRETYKALAEITPDDNPLTKSIEALRTATGEAETLFAEAAEAQGAAKAFGQEISMHLDKINSELEEHLARQREMKNAMRAEMVQSLRVGQTLQLAICVISVILGIVLALLAAKSVGTDAMPGTESGWQSASDAGDANGRLAALERRVKNLEEERG